MNAHVLCTKNELYPAEMLVLSHSTRSSSRECLRKGIEFRHLFGVPAVSDRNYAAETGVAMHRGFAHWIMTHDEDETLVKFMTGFPYDLEFLKPHNEKRSLEACYATLWQLMNSSVLQNYALAEIITQQGERKQCTELPFAIKITGAPLPIPVWFVGYIDCILWNHLEQRFIVVDLKTTRENVEDVFARFQWDEQCIPYTIVLEHALGKKIDELDVSYLWTYIDLINPKHELVEIKKTQADVTDWFRGLCADISQYGKHYKEAWWPRATDGKTCYAWNKRCSFFDECYYRDPAVLNSIIQGKPRKELFRNGDVPWITAELPFIG